MSARSCNTATSGTGHRRDEHSEGNSVNNSPLPTVQTLLGYVNSPTNPLARYVEEITSKVHAVAEETEKIRVRSYKELEESRRQMSQLQEKILHSENNCIRYRKERDELRQRQSNDQEMQKLKRELAEQKHAYDRDYKEWEKNLKQSEETSDAVIKDQKLQIGQIERDLKHRESDVKRLQEKLEDSKFGFSEMGVLRKKLEESKRQLNDTNDKLCWVKSKLKETEKELDETKTRLSKSMGERLTDNNPNIADLSDKNRPTKLAERYAELYDNQWTDAFETIELHYENEEDIIEALLKILEDVSKFCKSVAQSQMEKIERALTFSDDRTDDFIPTTIKKQLKDCRKALSCVSKEPIYKLYLSRLETSRTRELRHGLEIEKFVKECFEICWLMVIQDPPVVFAPIAKGEILNTDKYRPYTRNGKYVKFTVWPAMLLNKGGPVLAKGVAQGEGRKQDKDEQVRYNAAMPKVETNLAVAEMNLVKPIHTSGYFVKNYEYENAPVYKNNRGQPFDRDVSSEVDRDHHRRAKSEGERRYTNQLSTRTRNPESKLTWKPYKEYDRDPTDGEMRTYFYYFDRREYNRARDVLGSKAYWRCMRNEHKRHLYCN